MKTLAPPSLASPAGFIAPPKPNLSRNVSPMHAELHAANAARFSAMDKAKDAMKGAAPSMPSPMGAVTPSLKAPKLPGMKTPKMPGC